MRIDDTETIILIEYIQKYWRYYFRADEHGYTNFLWTFLQSSEDKQLDFLKQISDRMDHD